MKTNVLRRLSISMVTTAVMRYTLPLAIVQVLCVMLFAVWMISL